MPDTIPTLRLRSSEDLARDLGGSAGRVTMALDEDLRVRGKAHTAIASRVWGYQVMLDLGCDKLDIIDQINGELWLLNRAWCDLVLWAPDLAGIGRALTVRPMTFGCARGSCARHRASG